MTRTRLDAVCDVSWGDTTKTKASYVDSGYPAYSASGRDGFLPHFDHEGPGIVLSAIGAQCGKTWFATGRWSCIKNTIYIKTKRPEADPRFVFYATCDSDLWPKRGAAQPFISQTDARAVEIPLPALSVQRRIAGILAAYDDLIENCERRIKVLDDMARAIYREWFVDFRFPGAQANGKLPASWREGRLDSVVRVNAEQINVRNAPAQIRYIDISSVSPDRIDQATPMSFSDAPGRARRVVRHGDVLWSCVRPNRRSHALVMNPEPNTVASTGFAVLTSDKIPFAYLYLATTTDEFVTYLEQRATGAAYPAVTAAVFEAAPLLIPEAGLLARFAQISVPLFEMKESLHKRIDNLRATRDLLLPRLLSGQLPVAEAA